MMDTKIEVGARFITLMKVKRKLYMAEDIILFTDSA